MNIDEKKSTEKLNSTIDYYCKEIGFVLYNQAIKDRKFSKSYLNCRSFLSENKELFLETLRINYNLESLEHKLLSFSGLYNQLGFEKDYYYEDLLNMKFLTKKMTESYRSIKTKKLEEQPVNSFVQNK